MLAMDLIHELDGMDDLIVPRTSTSYQNGKEWLKANCGI
jgi:hypothetical protein